MTVPETLAACSRCCGQSWRSLVRGLGTDGSGERSGCSHTPHPGDGCREVSHLPLVPPPVKWRGDSQLLHRASPSWSLGTKYREDSGFSSTHHSCSAPFKDRNCAAESRPGQLFTPACCCDLWLWQGWEFGLNLGHKTRDIVGHTWDFCTGFLSLPFSN